MGTKIKSIKYIGKIEQKCISVSAKDGLYYTDENIITHNSALQFQNGINYKIINGPGAILGQSQPLDCKIYLPDGSYKLMKDIKIGDKIASPTEKEQTVLGIFPQGKKKTFKITLSDGRTTRCSPDHLWKISWKFDKNNKRIWVIKPLQFIIDHAELDIKIWDKIYAKIIKIEEIEESEQQCLYVSSKDHLYITDDKICTHNTIIMGSLSELTTFTDEGWSEEKILKFFTKLRKRIDSRMNGNYFGRSQPLNSKVLMSNGIYKNIGDTKIGDKIQTPGEGIQKIITKTEVLVKKCFLITLSDGRTTRCSPDHLWKVSYRKDFFGKKIWEIVTTQFMIDNPKFKFEIVNE